MAQGRRAARELTDEERELLESLDLQEARRRLEERLQRAARASRRRQPLGRHRRHLAARSRRQPSDRNHRRRRCAGRHAARWRAPARTASARCAVTSTSTCAPSSWRCGACAPSCAKARSTELDVEATIDKTATNGGELEMVLRPERRPDVKVLLLLDVGGSMEPHVQVCERLFSAAKRATHWKRLETFYFHNCVYGHVYPTTWLRDGIAVPELLAERDASWKLIVVGDALMHPSELWQTGGSGRTGLRQRRAGPRLARPAWRATSARPPGSTPSPSASGAAPPRPSGSCSPCSACRSTGCPRRSLTSPAAGEPDARHRSSLSSRHEPGDPTP